MNDENIKELIESFIAYRNLIAPLQDSLHSISKTYEEIRGDLENLSQNFSGEAAVKLEKVHATLSSQARSGQELIRKIDEYASSGEKYSSAVKEMTAKFSAVAERVNSLEEIEKTARSQIERIDTLIAEKKSSYNLKELQKSLDSYNVNVEKISDFINRDIAEVLKSNAEKIEEIGKENERLSAAVIQQSKDIATLAATFKETAFLLKKVAESGTVNEEYLFDAFDKWAADRKVKIKKK